MVHEYIIPLLLNWVHHHILRYPCHRLGISTWKLLLYISIAAIFRVTNWVLEELECRAANLSLIENTHVLTLLVQHTFADILTIPSMHSSHTMTCHGFSAYTQHKRKSNQGPVALPDRNQKFWKFWLLFSALSYPQFPHLLTCPLPTP